MNNKINIIEILNKYNIDYKDNIYSDELDILCPFHNDHHFGSAKINKKSGLFNCFSCGNGGNIYHFVALLEGISDEDAYKMLTKREDVYDLNILKKKIKLYCNNEEVNTSNEFISKMLSRILTQLRKKDVNIINKWISICAWVLYFKNVLNEKDLLEVYTKFTKDT